ncbi:MAG: FKBP-type peptidyl-prolyl cis-trans isomerase N-terminal domain-containing protein, partial [Gammaproteobacteria bacterium]
MRIRNLALLGCLLAGQAGAVGTSLESDAEKYSYAIGINFAQSLMRQGVPLDADAVYMAIQDALAGSELRLSAETMSEALRAEAQRAGERKRDQAAENMRRGKEYMAQNKTKDGVTTLPNGIQYEVLRKGTGAQPKKTDTVTVHYVGTLVDGREFDSSKRRGEPATFQIG